MSSAFAGAETCLATATSEGFVPGTLVMIASFLEHHPLFDGDVVVIHDNLPEVHRRQLAAACGRLRFEQISPELRERLAALSAALPSFAPKLGQFYSLEAFRLRGYRKVLFYDSDVLFQSSVQELFNRPEVLLCCGDSVFLRGWRRDAATFAPAPPENGGALERTFGAGFLMIDGRLVEEDVHRGLLQLVSPATWRGADTPHTDQLVLNQRFAGRQTLVGWTYDFVLPMAEAIRAREGTDAASAKALHFAGAVKPWMPHAMLHWADRDASGKPEPAFVRWYDAYVRHLARANRAHALQGRRREARSRPKRIPGANHDLPRRIKKHLFVICPNNSGSSFLAGALEQCRATWRLPREGTGIRGFAGPVPWRDDGGRPGLLWASEQRWIDLFADPKNYDWPRNRKVWYFHSYARDPDASVFVTKSPPHLLCVEQLARHFRNAKFLFMVRNPYAVCEGICRRYRTRLPARYLEQYAAHGRSLPEAAATHAVNCLVWQRRNIEAHRSRGVLVTYEEMCRDPAAAAGRIQALVPELDDLNLRQRIAVKEYDEMLTDMNPRQLARLDGEQIAALNRVFHAHREALAWFGYSIMAPRH